MSATHQERLRWNTYTRRQLWGFLFVLPVLVFFAVFAFYPMISAFYYSLTDYNLISAPVLAGLKNYQRMLHDARFLIALKNTFVYAFGSTGPIWVISLGLALIFVRDFRGRNLVRTLYFAPVIVSGVVVSIVWRVIYHPYGPLNAVLGSLLGRVLDGLLGNDIDEYVLILKSS